MDAEKIERRLRRLDAALARTERRLGTLLEVRNFHERRLVVALSGAEADREAFVAAARVTFREPYRALKAWERHEFRLSKLTLTEQKDAEVAAGAYAAVSKSTGLAGLTLRGRTILGRDDAERIVARQTLATMGEYRTRWLEGARRARLHGLAFNRVGDEVRQMRDRLRSIGERRAELLEHLFEHGRSPARAPEPEPTDQGHRPALNFGDFVREGLSYETARRRLQRLDRAAVRYLNERDVLTADQNVPTDVMAGRIAFLDRRLDAYRRRARELGMLVVRGERRLPVDIRFTDEDLADLWELHAAYRDLVEERLSGVQLPEPTPEQRQRLAILERRTERLEKAIGRYASRLKSLNDPTFDIGRDGPPTHSIADPQQRADDMWWRQDRLRLAQLRQRTLRETLAAERANVRLPEVLTRQAARASDRGVDMRFLPAEERAKRERDRLARLYERARRERQRDLDLDL